MNGKAVNLVAVDRDRVVLANNSGRFRPLEDDRAMPSRCCCCEPSRKLVRSRVGPDRVVHYCPTTRAAYIPATTRTGSRILLEGIYSGPGR